MNRNQLIELYKEGSNDLFALFCVYPVPNGNVDSYIQHWAFVDSKDLDLFTLKFVGKVIHSLHKIPEDRKGWLDILNSYTALDFQAFGYRKSFVTSYDETMFDRITLNAESEHTIKLSGNIDWVIGRTKENISGVFRRFYQAAILTTLEAGAGICYKGTIEFSDNNVLDIPTHFRALARNGRVSNRTGNQISTKMINYGIFEEVILASIPPTKESLPADEDITDLFPK
jgi:hypothetical protein